MLIGITAIMCGILAVVILCLLREYIKRYHIDLFYAMRYYIDKERPPQSLMEYKIVRLTIEFVKKIAELIPKAQFIIRLDQHMRRAGIPLLGSEFIVVAALSAILVGFIVLSLTLELWMAVAAGIAVIIIECFMVSWLVRRRRNKFVNQLGDCLTTVSNALRAGFSFLQAMDLVSREMEPPISEEFAHVMRDISYGMVLEQALEDMDKRVGSADFNLVVTAVLIQREVGGNLAQVLDTISDTINNRIRMRREIITLTAQGRMSSWVLSGLPIVIAAIQYAIDNQHFDEMLENKFGFFILIVAVVLEVVGFIIIRKIVNIKVE